MKTNSLHLSSVKLSIILKTALVFLLITILCTTIYAQSVATDKSDYMPGETVQITGIGFSPNESVLLEIEHIEPNMPNPFHFHDPWLIMTDEYGNFTSSWYVNTVELNTTLLLKATGQNSGFYAETIFTDGSHTGFTSATIAQGDLTICTGNSANLSLNVVTCFTSAGGGTSTWAATYLWQQSSNNSTWITATGTSTNNTYSASPGSNTYYRCQITITTQGSSCGLAVGTVHTTPSILITIGTNPTSPTLGTASPLTGSTICAGFNTGTVTGTGGSGGSTGAANEYQVSINGGSTYSAYTSGNAITTTGATGSVIVQARRTGGSYGCSASAWSTICTWTVGSTPTAPTLGSASPSDGSEICADFNTGTVTGTGGSGGSTGATNEYQVSINGGITYSAYTSGNPITTTGATGSVIVQARRTGGSYGCSASAWSTICTWTIAAQQWTGAINNDWNNAGNWCGGVPTSGVNVTIPSSTTVHITSSPASFAECNNLTIDGTLVIDAGKALTVNGTLTNSGTLNILSDATGAGSLLTSTSITGSGTYNIERYISSGQWHYISVPNNNSTATIFNGDYLKSWDETTATWNYISIPATTLTRVKGYALWRTNTAGNTTYTFTGTPNNDAQSIPITLTAVNGINDGANFLGNPYPSSIDWNGLNTSYGAIYYYNGTGYVSWNGAVSNLRYVQPMQGFFIIAPSTGMTFNLNNSNRVHSSSSFYKSALDANSIALEAKSNNDYMDPLLISFNPQSSEGFDLQYDAYKLFTGTTGISQLYSFTGDTKLSIDARPECEVIQLGFTNDQSGDYQIGVSENSGVPVAVLEDTKTNTFHDLIMNGAYTFNYTAGENEKRFLVHFSMTGVDEPELAATNIYSFQKTVYIDLKDMVKGEVFIYNTAGQMIATSSASKGMNEIKLPNTGIYMVKVITAKSTMVKKVWIQ